LCAEATARGLNKSHDHRRRSVDPTIWENPARARVSGFVPEHRSEPARRQGIMIEHQAAEVREAATVRQNILTVGGTADQLTSIAVTGFAREHGKT
jgi:hypothetical protein